MQIPQCLKTERLVIRPCTFADLPQMQRFFSDDEVTRYLLMDAEEKMPKAIKQLLEMIISSYNTHEPIFALAITQKDNDLYIGSCGLSPTSKDEVEIYYALLYEYWGQGYATEAMNKLFEYAFSVLGLEKLVAFMHPDNYMSQKVAQRLKMACESNIAENRKDHHVLRYSITKELFDQE